MKKSVCCTTAEEMKEKFIAEGWSKNITFTEFTLEEATERRLLWAIDAINKGEKLFKMGITGNIFKSNGEIAFYNVPIARKYIEIDFRLKNESKKFN